MVHDTAVSRWVMALCFTTFPVLAWQCNFRCSDFQEGYASNKFEKYFPIIAVIG